METTPYRRRADLMYREARRRWAEIVDLSVYDDEDVVTPVAGLLEQARRLDPGHVKAHVLLSDLLMEIGADREALEVVDALLALEPGHPTHARKRELLEALQRDRSRENRAAVRAFVERRWTGTQDW